MTTQPTALRLADELMDGMNDEHWNQLNADAAAELRRLHAENEALRESLKTEELISFRRQMQQYAAQVEKDEALLRLALEALDWIVTGRGQDTIEAAHAALKERLGENT